MSKVFVYKCKDYYEDGEEVINKIISSFDVLKNIKPYTNVVIKANLVSAFDPDKGATTHYLFIKYLTNYLLSKKCNVTIGDSPGGLYNKNHLDHVYKVTKMNLTNANLNANFSISKAVFNDAKVLKTFEYTSYLAKADIIINFSKLKTHAMMGMSAAVKNMFGVIPGTVKTQYHYRFPKHDSFANMLIDINEYFKCSINIIDAVIGMEGNGPTMGDPKQIGCVLASSNPYELDYVASKIISLNYKLVETIKQSINRKLLNINNVELNDDINKYIIKDFKNNSVLNNIEFYKNDKGFFKKIYSKVSERIFLSKPVCNKKVCKGCEKCANICPQKAIIMKNNKPIIDRNKCIKCYCCQEFCPFGAMKAKKTIISKLLK